MPSEPCYLLIVACSQRKCPDSGLLPAIERYDGVNFRVLRKAKREGNWPKNLDVLILSAKYGMIGSSTLIENYDQKMTLARALELQPQIANALDTLLNSKDYREIFVNLGETYLVALALSQQIPQLANKVRYASGGIGKKMSQMKTWLSNLSSGMD